MKWNCNFNNWIRKLFFFFFSINQFSLFILQSYLIRISSTVKKKKNEASLSKDIKIFSFRNSGLIMSEKNFVFQSRFSFPRKGRNRISRIHSFERTKSWTNMSEKTGENERRCSMTHSRTWITKESPTTSSRSRHSCSSLLARNRLVPDPASGDRLSLSIFTCSLFCPRTNRNLRILLLSLHEPPLVYK